MREALIGMHFFETNGEWSTGPVVIGDQRAFAGAVGIRLPDADLAGFRAVRAHAGFVVLDFTMLRIAQQARMYKAEVRDVEEVLDHARPQGAKRIRTSVNEAEGRVITVGELRRIAHAAAPMQTQTMPYCSRAW